MTAESAVRQAIWLEPTHLHFHHGDNIVVKVLWGRAMRKDGVADTTSWKGCVMDPAGKHKPAQITPASDGSYYTLVFGCEDEGMYTAQVESDPSGQRARILVPVGHHVHGQGTALNRGLEIVPGNYGEFHPGDTVVLTVLNDGVPLAGAQMQATYHLYEGTGFAHSIAADEFGRVQFIFDALGHWLFQVDSRTDNRAVTATLVIPGVRR